MPTYTSKCEACGTAHTYIRKVADRNDTPLCCDLSSVKQLDTPMVAANFFTGHKGFHMPDGKGPTGKGTWIEDSQSYNRFMKEGGYVQGDEGAQEAAIQTARKEKADDAALTKAVVDAVATHSK